MNVDFTTPQKQSPVGVVVMFFDTLRKSLRAFWPVIILLFVRAETIHLYLFALGTFIALAFFCLAAYLRYINFTFWMDEANSEFIVSEGVFSKTRTAIRLDKIQQVNINQSLIQRLIGVYALEVDTAGSSSKEGNIKAVSHELALALKDSLLNKSAVKNIQDNEAVTDFQESKPFLNISLLSLFKVGITTNYLRTFGLILAFAATIFDYVKDFWKEPIQQETIDTYLQEQVVMQSISILLGVLIFAVIVINVVRMIFRFFDFTILRQNGSLLLSYGLLNKKSTLLKPSRVQIVTVTQNLLQKKIDILELKVSQAASSSAGHQKSAVEIPGCNEQEKHRIFSLLFRKSPERGQMLTPNIRRLIFSIFFAIVLPLGIYAFVAYFEPRVIEYYPFAIAFLIFGGLIQIQLFRNYRLFVSEDFIIKKSGVWDISNEIAEPEKIQAIVVSQLFWHRPLGIGSIAVHTAGGKISFSLGKIDILREFANRWLYNIERDDKDWM